MAAARLRALLIEVSGAGPGEAVQAAAVGWDGLELEQVIGLDAALDTLASAAFHVIILDAAHHEPGVVSQISRNTTTPVVALTDSAEPAACAALEQAGAAVCLPARDVNAETLRRAVEDVIERHRAGRGAELRRHLLERVERAAVATDESGAVCAWNAGAERMYGWTEAEAIGRHILELTAADWPAVGGDNVAGVLKGGSSWSGEARHRRRDGSLFPAHVTYSAVRDGDQRIVGMTSFAEVLRTAPGAAERRSAATAAPDQQALRAVIDASPIAIVAQSADHLVTMWNPAAERIFGWRADEVLGRPLPFVPEADQPRRRRHMAMAMRGEMPPPFEAERLTRDGRVIRVAITTAPLYGASGEYSGVMGLIEDVTERRAAEEQQRRLHEVVEASPSFVATFDGDGRPIYMNRAGRRLLGVAPGDDLQHLSLHGLHTAQAADTLLRSALPTVTASGTWTGETMLRTRDGDGIPVWESLVAHYNERGDLQFISVVADDLSERRRLEEQLRQSQKLDAVGRLAGGVAHDFNNLLTAIAGHTQLLIEELHGNPDQRRELEEVMRAVDSAATLTRQLLAFSRRQVLQPKILDVNDVVRDMTELLRRLIGSGVEINMELNETGAVRADQGQLQQVLLNLVVNARDAMPQGGVVDIMTGHVTLDDRAAESFGGLAAGSYTLLRVRDSGEGMDEDVLPRIFEPFFTTRDYGKGAGLGLPTVYGIVTQSGGGVRVSSRPGEGATFEVVLPVVEAEKPVTPAGRDASRESAHETILLAEDEPAVRRLGVRILERSGYRVLEAESGVEALALFQEHGDQIAMLVTDVVMPGMNGSELAQRLQELRPSLPVLFTSGYTADAISRVGGLPPGTAFLEKPFTPDALAGRVREILDNAARAT